ncbi:MAG: NAD(P)/FAD-dependent oxidoreductase [Chitinophagales bacterium]|nr:FAD-dependent oxidoreductase [Bacteroidota bacterium]MCB9043796.1 FAD-dependent oxidoreductase [Chitinophagales bacterium]
MGSNTNVIVIGAGISGLAAAYHLHQEGLKVQVLEASERAGGRIKTDKIDGFLLDRGFQVLLTAYPEAQRIFNYEQLALKNFYPGALIHFQGKMYRLADPFREWIDALKSLNSTISNIGDKFKMLALRNRFTRYDINDIFAIAETDTEHYLKEWNFSPRIIRSFFRPFFGGIFLDPQLSVSNRMFGFCFKMFSEGYAALPEQGMEALSQQLADKIPSECISYNTKVREIKGKTVVLESGEVLEADAILVATDQYNAAKLLPFLELPTQSLGVQCMYFSADKSPLKSPYIVLNGNTGGLVNNLAIPNLIQPNYAPANKNLISVSIIKKNPLPEDLLIEQVKEELSDWFGAQVKDWQHLKTYHIPQALPYKQHLALPHKNDIKTLAPHVYMCGDHTHDPSINGALRSAFLTANAISWDLAVGGDKKHK